MRQDWWRLAWRVAPRRAKGMTRPPSAAGRRHNRHPGGDAHGGQGGANNEKLNFVVLDFGFKRLPRAGQQLGIYRLGEKIGQVRVSGPAWETYTVADIVEGEIWVGDEARLK